MFSRFVVASLLASSLVGLASQTCRADDAAEPKALETALAKTLDAYNKNDVKAFFADWASTVAVIANEMTYDALYKNGAKQELGDYVPGTIKLRQEGSVLTGDFLVVYFDLEFTKSKQGQAAANFQKENGAYKFIQLQLSKKP